MTKNTLLVVGAVAAFLALACAHPKEKRMIPPVSSSFIKRGVLDAGFGAGNEAAFTSLWLPAGWAHNAPVPDEKATLRDLATNGDAQPDFDPVQTLAGYDEVYVHVANLNVNGGAGGNPIVVRFSWRDNTTLGVRFDEMALDQGLLGNGPPAAGATDNEGLQAGATVGGVAANVRRYTPSVAEFGPIEVGTGRVFPLRVKHALLNVRVASIGAPGADQFVIMQLVPHTIGGPK